MPSFFSFLVVGVQMGLLFGTAAGWGFWVWKLAGLDRRPLPRAWLVCGIVGFAANTLLLQNLVYCDARLGWTAWLGLTVALAGCLGLGRHWLARNRQECPPKPRPSGATRLAALVVVILLVQGSALIYHGPYRYYGWGHIDQVNYVNIAQFLVDKPFSTNLLDMGLHPWLTLVADFKDGRLGQSVIHGYLAVISLTDTQVAYGALTVFHVAMLGAFVHALLRALSVPRGTAFLGSLWVSLLPAVTKIHLDGFLSQITVLAVFPALALTFLVFRTRPVLLWVFNTVLLSYLFCCYTEVFVLGVGLTGLLWLTERRYSWPMRLFLPLLAVAVAVAVVPGAAARLVPWVLQQYRTAGAEPYALYVLVPVSGTWQGWAQTFCGYPDRLTPTGYHTALLLGFAVLGLAGSGFLSRSPRRKIFLCCLAATPMAVLIHLLSSQVFPKYAFTKLLDTFSPLWALLAVLGLARLQIFMRGQYRFWPRWGANACLAGLLTVGTWGTGVEELQVIHDEGSLGYLKDLNSPASWHMFKFVKSNPDKTYLIDDPSFTVDSWLAYHARNASAYIDFGQFELSNRGLPSGQYPFHQVPTPPTGIWLLRRGVVELTGDPAATPRTAKYTLPAMVIKNPQGVDRVGQSTGYWVGKSLDLDITQAPDALPDAPYRLVFNATAGPANPDRRRLVQLSDGKGQAQKQEIVGGGRISWGLRLQPGLNQYRLEVLEPGVQTVKLPGDPRNVMFYVEEPHLVAE